MTSTPRHRTSDLPTERRQITVLFCDLVGSTAFGAGRDEEDVLEVFAGYQRGVAEIVARLGGYVAKYMGDGVLAYFGYPEAHEDDAERAVQAGLALVSAVERLTTPAQGLQLRVGIATGVVVVGSLIGSGQAQERTVVGEALSLAARLQALASPDTVVIGNRTRRLIGNLFACRPIGPVSLKGFAEPQLAWEVTGASAATSRFEALRADRLTPMVGRMDEIATLRRRWGQVKDGDGQVVLLSGEPGIGKSRFVATLCEQDWMRSTPHTELRLDSLPHHADSVLHPFIAQLEHAAGLQGAVEPGERLSKLEAALALASLPEEGVSLLADLLSIPTVGCYPALDLAPQRRRERTAEALLGLVLGLARRRSVLLVLEDAHWSDEASLEVLSLLVDHAPAHRVLIIVTSRPEFDPPWAGRPHVTSLTLERLKPLEATAIARWIVGADAPACEVVSNVVERANGVPLFIEELTKALLETQAAPGTAATIPFTLHGLLTARLDHLSPAAREVAQVAAVIGRDVSSALLAAVATLDGFPLETAFQELTHSGLMLRHQGAPDAAYSFKHALVQDAAYGALLRHRRRDLHAKVVSAIEVMEPATLEREPQALARHCMEGELFEKAVMYRLKAGVLAFKRSALAESIEQLGAGLVLLDRIADDGARSAHARALQTSLARVLAITRGYGDPSVGEAYAKARLLCQGVADPGRVAEVLFGEFGFYLIRGPLQSALMVAEDLSEQAAKNNDEAVAYCSHGCRGMALAHMGKLAAASESLQAAVAMQGRIDPIALSNSFGELPSLVRGYLTWVLVACGHLDQACQQEAELLDMAPLALRTLGAACASCFSVWTSQLRRDPDAARPRIDPLVRLCDEHGYIYWQAVSLTAKGWLVADAGEVANGITLLEKGLAAYQSIGSESLRSIGVNALAEALTRAGRGGQAINMLDEMLALVAETGDRWLEAEMLRLKGEALIASNLDNAAEECFTAAIRVAREQGALLWELRASVSLAGLWCGCSRLDDARNLLRPVYDQFREGLHSRDLRAARDMLEAVEA